MKNNYYISAYSASPSGQKWIPELESLYFQFLAQQTQIIGIEHPYLPSSNRYPLDWLSDNIPAHWSICITMIPALMQLNQGDPYAGLASTQNEGRQKALNLVAAMNDQVKQLNQLFGRQIVKAIHLQSTPSSDDSSIRGNKDAFKRSLAEIAAMAWQGAALNIEHCDAYIPRQTSKKGYLLLDDEIEVAEALGEYGIILNWARSAIEYRSAEGALKQLQRVLKTKLLRGYFFSGCTNVTTGLYANWQDRHMPPQNIEKDSLLTREQIQLILPNLPAEIYLGIKVHDPAEEVGLVKSIDMVKKTLEELEDVV